MIFLLWVALCATIGSAAPQQNHTFSYEPDWVPPARKALECEYWDHLYVDLYVGEQLVHLLVDTGSADMVLYDPQLCNPETGTLCYLTSRSKTYQDEAGNGFFSLKLDREQYSSRDPIRGSEMIRVALTLPTFVAFQQYETRIQFLRLTNLIASGETFPDLRLNSLPALSGLLGFGYSGLSNVHGPTFLSIFANDSEVLGSPMLSIDFVSQKVYVGGIQEEYRNTLQWAAPGNDDYHSFRLYDLTVCGRNVFSANDSRTIANYAVDGIKTIIDTAATCLTLPEEIFDSVIRSMPLACAIDEDNRPLTLSQCIKDVGSTAYYLDADFNTILPTISFRTTPFGGWLHMNTSQLLLDPKDVIIKDGKNSYTWSHARPICINRGVALANGGLIYFGHRVLNSFITTLAMETKQVALANRVMYSASNIQCVENRACQGMQMHYDALNLCIDPPCDQYYFFSFNPNTKECELSTAFHVGAILVITIFLLIEIGVNEIHMWLSHKVVTNIEQS